jgi:hypothetical protein
MFVIFKLKTMYISSLVVRYRISITFKYYSIVVELWDLMNAIQQCENEFATNIAVLLGRNGYQVNFGRTVASETIDKRCEVS